MDHPPQLRAFPGWNQGSGAARPQRRLAELSLGSAGWRLRGNRGRGCGEVQSPLPRRTCNSGRFSSKPCFNMCVNLELSEKCFFLLDTRFGTVVTQREQVLCVLHEEPRQGHDVSVGCVWARVCARANPCKHMQMYAHSHIMDKPKEQRPILWLCSFP